MIIPDVRLVFALHSTLEYCTTGYYQTLLNFPYDRTLSCLPVAPEPACVRNSVQLHQRLTDHSTMTRYELVPGLTSELTLDLDPSTLAMSKKQMGIYCSGDQSHQRRGIFFGIGRIDNINGISKLPSSIKERWFHRTIL